MNSIIEKRVYTQPQLESVKLDAEISLALESSPPTGPDELTFNTRQNFDNDPYKII